MDYALNVPINSVSFGQVSIALLREAYKLQHQPNIFPIAGQLDLSAQTEDKDFNTWLLSCVQKAHKTHKKSNPVLKLWHLNQSMESISNKQILLTFFETDSPTSEEINVVKNNHKVVLTNQTAANIFSEYGCDNVVKIPLAFDTHNFKKLDKQYFTDGRISFNLVGKFEKRKNHAKIIQLWLKKFGNNPKYFLNCALWNHFIQPEQQKQLYAQILGNEVRWGNIQFLGWMPANVMYNDFLNSADIIIGMSGGEGFDLGVFSSLALGKNGVILNAHAYKEYANNENAVMVNPSGKEPCYDGAFFQPGQQFNQGNFYTWNDDEFISACEAAIKRVEKNRVNVEGLKLQEQFKYSDTFNQLYKLLEN